MSTSIFRTLKNIYASGIRRSAWQIATHNDTKRGVCVGKDDFGNTFWETTDEREIHLRTRWVEYPTWDTEISKVEPGWHYWLGYGSDVRPNQLSPEETSVRAYPTPEQHAPNYTMTEGAYVPYNTAKPKCQAWSPEVKERVEA